MVSCSSSYNNRFVTGHMCFHVAIYLLDAPYKDFPQKLKIVSLECRYLPSKDIIRCKREEADLFNLSPVAPVIFCSIVSSVLRN